MTVKKNRWASARIGKRYHFSAAHYLTGVPKNHPCSQMHGHNYTVEIEMRGEVSPVTGFIADYHWIDECVESTIKELDHSLLNKHIENPTAERIAQYIMDSITMKSFFSVTVWETEKCWAKVINGDGFYSLEDRDE